MNSTFLLDPWWPPSEVAPIAFISRQVQPRQIKRQDSVLDLSGTGQFWKAADPAEVSTLEQFINERVRENFAIDQLIALLICRGL
jgi:hypothetical protein